MERGERRLSIWHASKQQRPVATREKDDARPAVCLVLERAPVPCLLVVPLSVPRLSALTTGSRSRGLLSTCHADNSVVRCTWIYTRHDAVPLVVIMHGACKFAFSNSFAHKVHTPSARPVKPRGLVINIYPTTRTPCSPVTTRFDFPNPTEQPHDAADWPGKNAGIAIRRRARRGN